MEIKKLNRKGMVSIKEIMITIVIFVGAFGLFFTFIGDNAANSGVTIDSRYNDTYNNLTARQSEVTTLVTDLESAANKTTEAKIGDFAFFGLRGVLALMKLPLTLLNTATNAWGAIATILPIPKALSTMIALVILITILFAVIKFITSRGSDA